MRCVVVENQEGIKCAVAMTITGINLLEVDLETLYTKGSIGDSLKFTIVEMSEEEYSSTPVFMGW